MSDDNRVPLLVEHGRFQVWHQSGDGFVPVALVRGGNLLAGAVLTMSRTDGHWRGNEHILALDPEARSTTIGDVIVSPEGRAYQLTSDAHGLVFAPIDFPPHREQVALFTEWAHDYAAQERDAHERFREIVRDSVPQPEPRLGSVGPVNDNHHDRDGGIER